MSGEYRKPAGARGTVRLHLNENMGGCSPRVLDVIRGVAAEDAAFYPDYDRAYEAAAQYFGVETDSVLLTNGLDEGILVATAAAFRSRDGSVPEALGVAPAFDMYEICAEGLGGRMVTVPLGGDFTLDGTRLLSARTPATRIVFITTPHNPSGVTIPAADVRRLARDVAPALLFVDEAYAEFCGGSVVDVSGLASQPNVIVGRTFAKAFGLAGLRVGALVASAATLAPMRRIVPPYTLNAVTAAALPVAIADVEFRERYVAEAKESRALLGAACARLGLRTWPSEANFMLVDAGPRAAAVAEGLAARGVLVRDKSGEPGAAGCLRMTTGRVADTQKLVAALEEVLCDAPR